MAYQLSPDLRATEYGHKTAKRSEAGQVAYNALFALPWHPQKEEQNPSHLAL